MRSDIIQNIVPHADPVFLSIMERMPDPPSEIYEDVLKALPHLYNVFEHERDAAGHKDGKAFMLALKEQMELLRALDRSPKNADVKAFFNKV